MNRVWTIFCINFSGQYLMNILAGAPGGGHTGGEDGWQAVPSRPARGTFEKVTLLAINCARVKPVTRLFSSFSLFQKINLIFRWIRQESNPSQRARLTQTACPLDLQKLEGPAGAVEVRPRGPAELRWEK